MSTDPAAPLTPVGASGGGISGERKTKRADWPALYGRQVLAELDSTNAHALRLRPDAPEWICALRQTGGRGRRGRAWHMPQGNFAATLVMALDEPAGQVALRSFVAALALFDAVAEIRDGDSGLALKWPNDVLLQGGKLAGILLERSGQHLAIGIGVNLAAAPPVDSLEPGAVPPVALGVECSPEDFLDVLAARYAEVEALFRAQGFGPIRSAWLARAARLGETLTARTPRETWVGVFETVDLEGQLVLNTAKGRVAIPAADVYF